MGSGTEFGFSASFSFPASSLALALSALSGDINSGAKSGWSSFLTEAALAIATDRNHTFSQTAAACTGALHLLQEQK
eukprot:3413902-Pleurochrysis_carterae.AAC.2